jgi:hypothetical protein
MTGSAIGEQYNSHNTLSTLSYEELGYRSLAVQVGSRGGEVRKLSALWWTYISSQIFRSGLVDTCVLFKNVHT